MTANTIVNRLLEDDLGDEIDTFPDTVRGMIYREYQTTDTDTIYAEAASRRTGTPHEEKEVALIGGVFNCDTCGALDRRDPDQVYRPDLPDPIYHPECYL